MNLVSEELGCSANLALPAPEQTVAGTFTAHSLACASLKVSVPLQLDPYSHMTNSGQWV